MAEEYFIDTGEEESRPIRDRLGKLGESTRSRVVGEQKTHSGAIHSQSRISGVSYVNAYELSALSGLATRPSQCYEKSRKRTSARSSRRHCVFPLG